MALQSALEIAEKITKKKHKPRKFEIKGREATIRRAIHDDKNPYIMINRQTLEDNRLSFKARGLLAYMLTRPQGWEFNISHLVNQSDEDGRSSIRSALDELEDFKYITRSYSRDKGKFTKMNLFVYETPQEENNSDDVSKMWE